MNRREMIKSLALGAVSAPLLRSDPSSAAQLMPVPLSGYAFLELKRSNSWTQVSRVKIDAPSRTARFRLNNWSSREDVPYRVRFDLSLRDGAKQSHV